MKNFKSLQLCIFLFCTMIPFGFAETVTVDDDGPADFNNIQDAINYSWDGDTVLVYPGTDTHFHFNGRRITLTSLNPDDENIVKSTIITSGGGPNTCSVHFDFGEDSDSIITGFALVGNNVAINCTLSAPTITKNIIMGNSEGTGIFYCDGIISNNIISDCSLGINSRKGVIKNNTIVGNKGGIGLGGDSYLSPQKTCVKNNIIANNSSYGLSCSLGYAISDNSYNCFWDNNLNYGGIATAGTGDFWRDPLFAIAGYRSGILTWIGGDYHLKSEAGRWTESGWVVDSITSRCIDAGDPADSLGLEPNPNGGRINMGAYGGTSQASKSSSGIIQPVCIHPPSMDTNNDCKIDLADFAFFAGQWLTCGYDIQGACWE